MSLTGKQHGPIEFKVFELKTFRTCMTQKATIANGLYDQGEGQGVIGDKKMGCRRFSKRH